MVAGQGLATDGKHDRSRDDLSKPGVIVTTVGGIVIGLALVFAFLNGYNASGSLVATLISTGVVGPRRALLLAAAGNLVGPFLFGVAVAVVVGTGLVDPSGITLASLAAAVIAALAWNALASLLGIPSSSSHALLGGLIGGGIGAAGPAVVQVRGLEILALALLLAPLIAALAGWLLMRLTLVLTQGMTPRVNEFFRRGQLITAFLLALSNGTSSGQKTMGIIALVLLRAGWTQTFVVPNWVILVSALALALGVGLGGWRVIRTVGARFYRLRPVHGFVAQVAATVIVLGATVLGGPVSLNQIASAALIGVGASERLTKVRWEVAEQIALAWLITLPATAVVALIVYPLMFFLIG